MLSDHATHEAGGFGIEAGITQMLERMQTGRFKVFRWQDQWMEEFRYYRREEGARRPDQLDALCDYDAPLRQAVTLSQATEVKAQVLRVGSLAEHRPPRGGSKFKSHRARTGGGAFSP